MMDLKEYVYSHICRYSDQKNLHIAPEEISQDLDDFIERVNVPEPLGGFQHLINLIHAVSNISYTISESILADLHLPKYIYNALHEHSIGFEHQTLATEYYRKSYHKGWCSEYPFYVLLLKSHLYKLNTKSCELLSAFIKQYYVTIDTLRDPELATGTKTREEEACSNFRLLMASNKNNLDIIFERFQNIDLERPEVIAQKIEDYLGRIDTTSNYTNYLRGLCHFFRNDWKPVRSVSRNTKGARGITRYKNPVALPIVGAQDDIYTLLPPALLCPSSEGIDEDDLLPSQSFVVNNHDLTTKRDKTELLDTKISFDRQVKKGIEIDVTRDVIRAHNMGYQNTQLLMPSTMSLLVNKLVKYGQQPDNREIAIVAWIMLLLSKSISEIMGLVVFRDLSKKSHGLYIDENGQGWWHFQIIPSAKSRLEQSGLRVILEDTMTSCPSFLVKIITENMGCQLEGPIIKSSDIRQLTDKLTKKLKRLSDINSSGGLGLKRLINFVSYYINSTEIIDPIYIDFSYAVNMYTTRVNRSYSNLRDHHRCKQLDKFWQAVENDVIRFSGAGFPVKLFELRYFAEDHFIGSSFTPKQDTIIKLVNVLSARVLNSTPSFQHRMENIIAYHNAFTAYTAWMLLFGTGYRAAWNPLPTLALFLPSLNLMGISDKDNSDFSHSRMVAVPTVLKTQLIEFKRHLGCLRGLLRILMPKLCSYLDKIVDVDQHTLGFNHSEATLWYKTIRNSRNQHGPFFFLHFQRSAVVSKSLSPSELVGFCKSEICLPSNAGRHWLRSCLLDKDISTELINFQMGHWQAGEVPLGHYSALSHVDAVNELVPVLDGLFKEVGWQPIKSVLS